MIPLEVRLFAIEQELIVRGLARPQEQLELELAFRDKDWVSAATTEELQVQAIQMTAFEREPMLFACLRSMVVSFRPEQPKKWLLIAAFIILYQILVSLPCQKQT